MISRYYTDGQYYSEDAQSSRRGSVAGSQNSDEFSRRSVDSTTEHSWGSSSTDTEEPSDQSDTSDADVSDTFSDISADDPDEDCEYCPEDKFWKWEQKYRHHFTQKLADEQPWDVQDLDPITPTSTLNGYQLEQSCTTHYYDTMRHFKLHCAIRDTRINQAMYTIGLLSILLQRFIEETEFLYSSNEANDFGASDRRIGRYICEEKFTELLEELEAKIKSLHAEKKLDGFMTVVVIPRLQEAEGRLVHAQWLKPAKRTRMSEPRIDRMFIGIAIFLEVIKVVITSALPKDHFAHASIIPNGVYWKPGLSDHLQLTKKEFETKPKYSLTGKGWCPYTVKLISESPSLYQYAQITQPFSRSTSVEAIKDRIGSAHNACTHKKCEINGGPVSASGEVLKKADHAKNEPQHLSNNCSCGKPIPVSMAVIPLIDMGGIPLFVFDKPPWKSAVMWAGPSSDRSDLVKVLDGENLKGNYVAISHVWADGLGSDSDTGLLQCVLERIDELVRVHVRNGAFWMDSLGIPKNKASKKLAIRTMARVYAEAKCVVVIDSGISLMPVDAPIIEQLFRIMNSGWMQRLWTLQEGILAAEVFFVFANNRQKSMRDYYSYDGPKSIYETGGHLRTAFQSEYKRLFSPSMNIRYKLPAKYSPLLRDCKRYSLDNIWRYQTQRMRDPNKPRSLNFGEVCELLWNRTTTKSEDETLAVAGLLNVDTALLTRVPGEHRLSTLLQIVKHLPSDIIFIQRHEVEPNPTPNFSWAPASYLGAREYPQLQDRTLSATCTAAGLRGRYPVVMFKKPLYLAGNQHLFVRFVRTFDIPERLGRNFPLKNRVRYDYRDYWMQPYKLKNDIEYDSDGLYTKMRYPRRSDYYGGDYLQGRTCNAMVFKDDPWTAMVPSATPGGDTPFAYTNVLLVNMDYEGDPNDKHGDGRVEVVREIVAKVKLRQIKPCADKERNAYYISRDSIHVDGFAHEEGWDLLFK